MLPSKSSGLNGAFDPTPIETPSLSLGQTQVVLVIILPDEELLLLVLEPEEVELDEELVLEPEEVLELDELVLAPEELELVVEEVLLEVEELELEELLPASVQTGVARLLPELWLP